jgi:hypothetical protein
MALGTNLIITILEIVTLGHLKNKLNILKYYTYLQNFFALIASFILSVYLFGDIASNKLIPEFVRGLRYVATCGLTVTTFIFITFLGAGKKVALTDDDFQRRFNPKMANIILHYVCPTLSLVSFIFLEKDIRLCNDIWTGIVAIPSCVYWCIYTILSATKLWEEPYEFTKTKEKNKILGCIPFLLIPLSFVVTSFLLWNVK